MLSNVEPGTQLRWVVASEYQFKDLSQTQKKFF